MMHCTTVILVALIGSYATVNAHPRNAKCDLKSGSANIMTKSTIMGSTPTSATDLISFSANNFTTGGQQITVTISNLISNGAVIHSNQGTLSKPTSFIDKSCSSPNTLYTKSSVSSSYTLTLTVPSDISSVNSITISVLTASGYNGNVKRQQKSLPRSGSGGTSPSTSTSPSPATGGASSAGKLYYRSSAHALALLGATAWLCLSFF